MQSSYSNCKVDGDKILLDISAVAMTRYEKLEPPTQVAQLPDLDIVMVIKPPLSLPTQNVLAYLAGYLLKKITVNECIECQEQPIRKGFIVLRKTMQSISSWTAKHMGKVISFTPLQQ